MKSALHVQLNTSPEQSGRLLALQTAFAEACNALAPRVQQTRCWNRVALHHLAYHDLRERFPQLGSQMVCNVIYSVSRTCRLVFQHPGSPWNIARRPDQPLPLLRFLPANPVYFDRHTLSFKAGQLSMYTLDGRMRFQLDLKPEDEARFHREKLREIVLAGGKAGYCLSFWFAAGAAGEEAGGEEAEAGELPAYLVVLPPPPTEASPPAPVPPVEASLC